MEPDEAAKGLIEAGKVYPGAAVCASEPHPMLMRMAAEHAEYMARVRRQGAEMFKCWKQSPGHWRTAKTRHEYFGAGMAKGSNGIWYACIIGVS